VESQFRYSKFLSQQWQLANEKQYPRTTWRMNLRQLTVYVQFRQVNMGAITFLFGDQSSSRRLEKIGEDILSSHKVTGAHTLILGQNLNFCNYFFGGMDPSSLGCTLTRLGQSLMRVKI